jgi:hypothetical protein
MPPHPPLSAIFRDSSPLELLTELLQAVLETCNTNFDDVLELLQLTEYVQAELYTRYGNELHALLLSSEDSSSLSLF